MFRRLLSWRRRGEDADEGTGEGDESADDGGGWVPSRLDASVLYAHGMGDSQAEREIIGLQEKERLVEEHRRRRE